MKIKAILFSLISFILIMMGVCGCMDLNNITDNLPTLINNNAQNDTEIIDSLKSYAEGKYGRTFTVSYFFPALDNTYSNILTLTDGEHIFNVYQSEGYEPADDYPKAVLNKKFADHFNSVSNSECKVYCSFVLTNSNDITLEQAKNSSREEILNSYSLSKAVLIVCTEDISSQADTIFEVYKELTALSPVLIDFRVIQVSSPGEELIKTLENIPAKYEASWKRYPEIEASITTSDANISSASELLKLKEVR